MEQNRLNNLGDIGAKKEGILSLTLAPNGIHRYNELIESVDFLQECGMNQLIMMCYEPNAMKLAEFVPAEIQLLKQGLGDGGYTDMFFDNITMIRERFPDLPLIANALPGDIACYGKIRFFNRCKQVEIDGIDCAYYHGIKDLFSLRRHTIDTGLHFICAIYANAINMEHQTHREILEQLTVISNAEVFVVPSIAGRTDRINGERLVDIVAYIREIQKKHGINGRIIGIGGINDPEDAYQMTHVAGADGVHFSSAFIKKYLGGVPKADIASWLKEVKAAMKW